MSDWIQLDTQQINENEHHFVDGVEVVVGLSPDDVPDAVRGYCDKELSRFVIELNYMGGREPRVAETHDDHVTLVVGKHSGRLYQIQLDVRQMGVNAVLLKTRLEEVDEALRKFADSPPHNQKRRHYEAANRAVRQNLERLAATAE